MLTYEELEKKIAEKVWIHRSRLPDGFIPSSVDGDYCEITEVISNQIKGPKFYRE